MKYLASILILLVPILSFADVQSNQWITKIAQPNDAIIELLWVRGGYEEFDSIVAIERKINGKLEKTLKVQGQPAINSGNTFIAVKNCWHGGCENTVKIINVEKMEIDRVVDVSPGVFVELTWIGNKLKIELFDPSPVDKVDEIFLTFDK